MPLECGRWQTLLLLSWIGMPYGLAMLFISLLTETLREHHHCYR
jgi:hypothetical protein